MWCKKPFRTIYGNVVLPKNTKSVVLSYFWALQLNNPNVNTFIRCCGNGRGGVVGRDYEMLPSRELEYRYKNQENVVKALKEIGVDVILILDTLLVKS